MERDIILSPNHVLNDILIFYYIKKVRKVLFCFRKSYKPFLWVMNFSIKVNNRVNTKQRESKKCTNNARHHTWFYHHIYRHEQINCIR